MERIDFSSRAQSVLRVPDLVAFWDFQNENFEAISSDRTRLDVVRQAPRLEKPGVFGPFCARFESHGVQSRGFLRAAAQDAPQLSIGGKDAQVTVVAWLKRAPCCLNSDNGGYRGCQFVAGVWNEHGKRQYGMFLNLAIWESGEQVGAHVSSHGGPTPGFPYCMDAAIGATEVDIDVWHCAAISYDGQQASVWLDGALDVRSPQGNAGGNPFFYPDGLLSGGADFTVGAVERPAKVTANADGTIMEMGTLMANPFVGSMGGLAVFCRALTQAELKGIADDTKPTESAPSKWA